MLDWKEQERVVSARLATKEESVVCSCVVLLCSNKVLFLEVLDSG